MKINEPNLSSLGIDGASKSQETAKPGKGSRSTGASAIPNPNDDVHLSELVRSLRSLAADSPERQARIEQIARAYADGAYHVDAHATASKMIDDSFET
jgi:flagellar biosynthesis anti-sigma factor FlgM